MKKSSAHPLSPSIPRSPRTGAAAALLLTAIMVLMTAVPSGRGAPVYRSIQPAETVLGNTLSPSADLPEPRDVAVDGINKKVYVADAARNRVLRFALTDYSVAPRQAEAVFGQQNFETSGASVSANTLSGCSGICVDWEGRLWVADTENNRVLRFDQAWQRSSGAAANAVLGQQSFLSSSAGTEHFRMNRPHGVAASSNGDIYVADTGNNRVLRFVNAAHLPHGYGATVVLGQEAFGQSVSGTHTNRMKGPQGVALAGPVAYGPDEAAFLYVADTGNHRVMRFTGPALLGNGASASLVLGQPSFYTANPAAHEHHMDTPKKVHVRAGLVAVADTGNHRVIVFDHTAILSNGPDAISVYGQEDFEANGPGGGTAGMRRPESVHVDGYRQLWVCDAGNSRLTLFRQQPGPAAGDADSVTGAATLEEDPLQTVTPAGLALCPATGKLFVSDTARHRVLRYSRARDLADGSPPEAVLGQPSATVSASGTAAGRMKEPQGIHVDGAGRLWVADSGNNRVLRFNGAAAAVTGTPASGVLGQQSFTTYYFGSSASGMLQPMAVGTDAGGRLWVSDSGNHRVLRFNNAAAKANGAAADGLLGHTAFGTANPSMVSTATLNGPAGLHADPQGRLWVADRGNHRVLRFDNAAAKANGGAANGVLGQWSGTGTSPATTANGLRFPADVKLDTAGRLWIADRGNRRVVRYDQAAGQTAGSNASAVLGQEGFTISGGHGLRARHLVSPAALALGESNGGEIWMADPERGRVARFASFKPRIVACGIGADNHFRLTFEGVAGVTYHLQSSFDLATWTSPASIPTIAGKTVWKDPVPAHYSRRFFRILEPED